MSFFFNLFSDNATPAERENAAAVKAMIKDRKTVLKAEYKDYEVVYKQELLQADADYKVAQEQAKNNFVRVVAASLNRELDAVERTDEFANSDEKTKNKIHKMRTWIDHESRKCGGEQQQYKSCQEEEKPMLRSPLSSFSDEKHPEGLVA
ncbi:hypothetical protein BGW38_001273 [Lunasporangiospora selenospora]|uniref:Uncharacterized protein n=1 Tax=Lunasporangiospora selenospora TaxID=979761 RepID=A0A9P6KE82_9FUNG|nr:hypothetical protein BGW38_001273 [Lunasporangiospora selenospora]